MSRKMNGEVTDLSAGASSPGGSKPWERPWSIDELKKSSTSWSLACDAGLLQHMQEYSQRLISHTHDIQAQMDGLAHEAKLTNSRLSNVFNDFITLANTQFMENRVYDEEVVQPAEEKSSEKSSENKTKTKEEKEAELIPKIKEAISLGLNVFDSAYETLDMNVANSDSEDEISVTKADIILEPKDPYINRILPYLIGSEQFHRLDDLGLKHALSVEKEDSGSESEDEVVKQAEVKRNSIANSASVKRQSIKESEDEDSDDSDLFGAEKKEEKPDESSSESASSEDETANNKQTTTANKPKDFSSELAAKLGLPPAAAAAVRGSAGDEKVSEDANDKKSKTKRRASKSEESKTTEKLKVRQDLFGSYEDDNADDGDDLFSKPTGLFSSRAKGLFDNEDDDEPAGGLFDKKQESRKPAEPKQQKSVIPEQKKPETSKPNQPSINPATHKSAAANKDLFAEEEDEDDDLFASLAAKPRAAAKTGQTIISDSDSREASDSSRPSSAVSDSSTKVKPKLPAGAVSLFGGADDPFKSAMKQKDQLEGKIAPSDAKKSSLLVTKETSSNQTSSGTSSLFGDDDDDGDDLFGASSKSTKSSQPQTKSTTNTGAATTGKPAQTVKASLFADDEDDGGDLFGNASISKVPAVKKVDSSTESKKSVVSNPVKDDDDDDDDDLFAFKPKSTKNDKSKQSSEAASASKSLSNKVPSTDTDKNKVEKAPVEKSKVPQNKAISLFGDEGDDDDDGDLFSAATKKKTSVEEISKPKKRSPEKIKPSRGAGGGGDLFADEDLLFGSVSVDTPAVDLFKPVSSSQNNSSFNPLSSSKSEPSKTSADIKPAAAAVDKQKDKTSSAASSGLFGASKDNNDDNDDDDDLFSTKPAKKIPPGAVSLFGNQHDLFAAVSKRRKSSSTDESSESKSRETTSPAKTTDSEKSNVMPSSKPAVSVAPKREKSVEKQFPEAKTEDISAIKANPVVQAGTIGNKPAASNLFSADDEVNDDDDDLFSTKPAKKIPPGAVSLFGNQSDLLKEAVNKRRRSSTDESVDGRETKSPEKSIPIIPKASDSAKKTDENKPTSSTSKSKISQLQSSLNIDPTANLPGAKPKVPAAVEISVGFNAPPTASTLNSIVKDRVKVQTKRRPPSRKTNQASDEVDEPDTSLVNSSTNEPSVDKLDSLNSEIGKSNLSQPKSPTSHLGNEDDLFSSTKVSSNKSEKEISNKTSGLSTSSADPKDTSIKQDKSNDVKIKTEITAKQQENPTISSNKDSSKIKDDGSMSNSTPSDNGDALDASGTVKNTQEEKSATNKNATTKSLLDRLDDADLFSISNLGSKSSNPTGKKLILSDDDDDLFGSGKTSKNSTTKSKAAPDDLFRDSTVKSVGKSVKKEDDSDLFPKVNQSSKSNVSNKPAVQLDDDDDIFSSSSLFTSSKKPPESKPAAAATGAAQINKGSDEDIFSESLNAKKGATNVKQSKVLADNDSDEDIFADSSLLKKPTASKSAVESKSQGPPTSSIRKKAVTKDENLFTDDTDIFSTASKPSSQLTGKTAPANKKPVDEDDIFGDQSISQKSTATSKSSSAAAGMKRVDSSDIFNDPLNALQK